MGHNRGILGKRLESEVKLSRGPLSHGSAAWTLSPASFRGPTVPHILGEMIDNYIVLKFLYHKLMPRAFVFAF